MILFEFREIFFDVETFFSIIAKALIFKIIFVMKTYILDEDSYNYGYKWTRWSLFS